MDNTLPPFNGHTRPMADDSYWVNGDREHDLFCIVAPYDQSPTLEFRHHLPSDHTWTRTEFEFYCIGFWDALQVAHPNAAIEVRHVCFRVMSPFEDGSRAPALARGQAFSGFPEVPSGEILLALP